MNKYENNNNNSRKDNKQMVFANEKIRAKVVRIVDDGTGNNVGTMPTFKALQLAKSKNLDLVQVSFQSGTSICRLCDYGKFMYEQKHKAKEMKKKAKASIQEVKELCFTIRIDDNDRNVKINHAKKFLSENCKVKLNIQFMRREMDRLEYGKTLMKTILAELDGLAELDSPPKAENRSLSCIIRPIKK